LFLAFPVTMGFGGPFDYRDAAPPSPPFPPLNPPFSANWYVKHADRTTMTIHAFAICVAATVVFLALYVGLVAVYDYLAELRRSRDMQHHKQALRAVREDDETDEDEEDGLRR
jgi:ABC-type spermidine/putrescine transport system permease subunit II